MAENLYYLNILELFGNGDISEIDEENNDEENYQNSAELLEQLQDAIDDDYYKNVNNNLTNNSITTTNDSLPVITPEKDIQWVQEPFKAPNIVLDDLVVSEIVASLESPIYYFMQYFDENTFEKIAFNTNLYATQKNVTSFKPTNKDEILKFVGIYLLMGCIQLPIKQMYWEEMFLVPMVSQTMTYERFIQLEENLHIINNLDIPINNQDKFVKVRPLYNQIKKKCNDLPKVRNLSIDEQMLPIKKLPFKVSNKYEKGKPWPWGIKIFVLCSENGIIYDFILYQGDSTELDLNNLKIFGLGPSIVLNLVQTVKKNSHFLFFNEYFSTYALMEHLYNIGIYAAGIVMPNRFANPLLLTDRQMSNMGPGTLYEMCSNVKNACSIGLVKCYDNKSQVLGSNFITMGTIDKIEIYDYKLKKDVIVDRPEIVKLYNASIDGVEKSEKYIESCRPIINSKKWTVRLIIHAFDMVVSNAWLQYKNDSIQLKIEKKNIVKLSKFRLTLAKEILFENKCSKV